MGRRLTNCAVTCLFSGIAGQDTFVNALQTCAVTLRPSHVASAHTPQQNQLLLGKTVRGGRTSTDRVGVCAGGAVRIYLDSTT